MSLPIFYIESTVAVNDVITLPEDASKHIVQVLRMTSGNSIQLANGEGHLLNAEIINDHKKKCGVRITSLETILPAARKVSIGISLLKNNSRFEWFLEKATEIGVQEIIPLLCERTERQQFRYDRMKNILVSAMLQSQQAWLPVLHQPVAFEQLFREEDTVLATQKFVAHCMPSARQSLNDSIDPSRSSQLILIGPEGDFTQEEITLALERQFVPVTLGNTRLRTETAGVVAAALLCAGR